VCGFFGVLTKKSTQPPDKEKLIRAGELLYHRGPDDQGMYIDSDWGVYFRRLSIIDTTSKGHQPMFSDCRRYVLAYNGELYNYVELRNMLIAKGHRFHTQSDTEVLLEAFCQFGPGCIDLLRGMFAFVVWDIEKRELHVFRDRLGIKPLYLYEDDHAFALSSEIKCILHYFPQSHSLDEATVFKFLAKGWVDDGTRTFYRSIKAVPAATHIKLSADGVMSRRYWRLAFSGKREFDIDAFRETFLRTISIHLRSDVPLATTLSGGMDSSSVTAVANRVENKTQEVRAFSVIPPETVDESSWIEKTRMHTGIKHSYLNIDFSNMSAIVGRVLATHDEPFQSSSCIYQYLLRKEIAKKDIKVLLVGEGGDEVFGGYRRRLYPFI